MMIQQMCALPTSNARPSLFYEMLETELALERTEVVGDLLALFGRVGVCSVGWCMAEFGGEVDGVGKDSAVCWEGEGWVSDYSAKGDFCHSLGALLVCSFGVFWRHVCCFWRVVRMWKFVCPF